MDRDYGFYYFIKSSIMRNMRIKMVLIIVSSYLLFPPTTMQAEWYFPMDKYYARQSLKGFGDFIDDNFYKGKEELFPYNRFYGYHSAVDLEVFPDEINKKVPVYAVTSGTIVYIGMLSGYGGVILLRPDNENCTVLYGHVKIKGLSFKVGDHINTEAGPVVLTYLGDRFSSETSKERKHLHFGIHKGTDLYFRGHEISPARVAQKWYNPNDFLKEKGASAPKTAVTPPFSVQ
jgi:murein DD-endopeptidase MepM/ murein hydrolase activator NlpD